MKAVTLHQPWASMIFDLDDVRGEGYRKPIETRNWGCYYAGNIAIHAGKTVDRDYCTVWGYDPSQITRGAVLGIVRVTLCGKFPHLEMPPHSYRGFATGDFSPGRYGWKLKVIEKFTEPIPARGYRLLWGWRDPREA